MRPAILNSLFADAMSIKGVGPAVKKALLNLVGYHPALETAQILAHPLTIRDVLFHLPTGCVDRRTVYPIAQLPVSGVGTAIVTVQRHYPSKAPAKARRKPPYKIIVEDASGSMALIYFSPKAEYLLKQLPEGETRVISGWVEAYDGILQMTHPDMVEPVANLPKLARLEPVYPLTHGISQRQLGKVIQAAQASLKPLPEWIDPTLKTQRRWPEWHQALSLLHAPQSLDDWRVASPARTRLAYDELLAHQLALALVREKTHKKSGIHLSGESQLRQRLLAQLPFALTQGQRQVLAEIDDDLYSGGRMLRLLQGDVGSGKTAVALLAMMPMIEAGYQVALMVPTEILGRQHVASIRELTRGLGLNSAMLTGKMSVVERRSVMDALEKGELHIVVGTHALFQEQVSFLQLGLVVIDEQHRFGVNQRLALTNKGLRPHVLLMTATPIPRSLTMTAYGDMECSLLTEKPAGRPRIETRAIPLDRLDEVVDGLKRAIAQGSKIYWICPLVEEPDEQTKKDFEGDLAATEERFRVFQQVFGPRVAMAHGKMKPAEREQALDGFAGAAYDILVATTVVEVGVNVPDATIIVIEHAERFGLAQLHQLRGRVGRSNKPSSCLLLYASRCSDAAKSRLKVIRESDDGFFIAEKDLELRGEGDVLGTRQSGFPDFHFADMAVHRELITIARDDVKLALHQDPALHSPRGQALRTLLYLFEYDASLRFLDAG